MTDSIYGEKKTFSYSTPQTRGAYAKLEQRKSLSHLHPESYHQLRQLVKLHGVLAIQKALKQIEGE